MVERLDVLPQGGAQQVDVLDQQLASSLTSMAPMDIGQVEISVVPKVARAFWRSLAWTGRP